MPNVYTIPTEDAPTLGNFDLIVDLEGRDFQFFFKWNDREGFWYVDVLNSAGEPIRTGLKCVINWPLLRTCQTRERPFGSIMVVDTRPEPTETGLENLGTLALFSYSNSE